MTAREKETLRYMSTDAHIRDFIKYTRPAPGSNKNTLDFISKQKSLLWLIISISSDKHLKPYEQKNSCLSM